MVKKIIFVFCINLLMQNSLVGASVWQVSRATNGVYSTGDRALTSLLEEMGHRVTLISDKFDPNNIQEDVDLVLITETVSSHVIKSKYRDIPVPCIVSDAHVFPGMAMTGLEEKVDFGFSKKEPGQHRFIQIVDPGHSLLSGKLSGICEVFKEPVTFHFGLPSRAGCIIARTPEHSKGGLLFTYEKGVEMVGAVAPARRVGVFIRNHHDNAVHLTREGKELFKLIVSWALGGTKEN